MYRFSLPALTDYVTGKTISYGDMARRIARLHLFFELAGIRQGDKIALLRQCARALVVQVGAYAENNVAAQVVERQHHAFRPSTALSGQNW